MRSAEAARAILGRVTRAHLRRACLALPGAEEDFPFGPETAVYRVRGKIFALILSGSGTPRINLKCEPALAEQHRAAWPEAVAPGYHMNKRHWNTIACDGRVPARIVRDMIEDSWDLVVDGLPRRARAALRAD